MNAKDAIKQIREEAQPGEVSTPAPKVTETQTEKVQVTEGKWEAWMEAGLDMCRRKFVAERVNGFTHAKSGKYFGPVPLAEAETRWKKVEPQFRDLLLTDNEIRESLSPRLAALAPKSADPAPDKSTPALPAPPKA